MPFTLESTAHLYGHAGSPFGHDFLNSGDPALDHLDPTSHRYGHAGSSLGQEFLINDAGEVSPVHEAAKHRRSSRSTPTLPTPTPTPTPATPTSTLVGAAGGLQIDLIWDSSVANAPSGFTTAIIDAAEYYTTLFSNDEVINIDVGYGEIAGSSMASNALGESESYGYLTIGATVTNALGHDGYPILSATNEPTASQFFVTSAEAKTLGLISPTSSALDGYIGFSALSGGYSWNTAASAAPQIAELDQLNSILQAVAEHEISEVMGRIGMEGEIVNGKPTYTPWISSTTGAGRSRTLSGPGAISPSTTERRTWALYNNASANGGDIADWASNCRQAVGHARAASGIMMPTMLLRRQATMAMCRRATSSRMQRWAMS